MNKLLLPLLLLLFFFIDSLNGQSVSRKPIKVRAIVESYATLMALEEPTVDELDTMLDVGFQYLFYRLDTCMVLVRRADSLATVLYPGERIRGRTLFYLGDAYRVSSKWQEAEEVITQGNRIFEALKMEGKVAAGYLKLGVIKTRIQEYEAAIALHLQALEIWQRLEDNDNIFKPYFEIADVFFTLEQPLKALEYNGKAEAWAIESDNSSILVHALNNRATIEKSIAINLRDQADTISLNPELLRDSVGIYLENARATMERSLKLSRKQNNPRATFHALNSLSSVNIDLENYSVALEQGYEAEEMAIEMGYSRFELRATANLTKALRLSGNYPEAITRGEAALKMDAAISNQTVASDLHEELYHAYRAMGLYKPALEHYEAYITFFNDDQEAERVKLVSEVEAKYQTVKKEKQIVELNATNTTITNQRNNSIFGALALLLLGFLSYHIARMRRERLQSLAFSAALIDAQESERKRIAQDLHDGVGQSLLLIKKELSLNTETTQANHELITATLQEVRSISHDLHPVLLEKFGLTATIEDMAQRIGESHPHLFITTEMDDINGAFTSQQCVQVYRCIQEALNNVIKHSGATAAKIQLENSDRHISISVQDNGRGFDYSTISSSSKSLGLQTMKERMSNIGATFNIVAGKPKGTVVGIVVQKK